MRKNSLILFAIITCISCFNLSEASAREDDRQDLRMRGTQMQNHALEKGIWGKIRYFTNHRITLENGQEYDFSKHVLIDTETLEKNKKGNVRILLDASGKARKIFFNGIDMPEVFRNYKR